MKYGFSAYATGVSSYVINSKLLAIGNGEALTPILSQREREEATR